MTITSPSTPDRATRARSLSLRKNNQRRSGVNRMAIVAAITGVLLFPIPLVGLCSGGAAMGQIRRSGQKGVTLAAIGIGLGSIGSAIWIGFWLIVLLNKGVQIPPLF